MAKEGRLRVVALIVKLHNERTMIHKPSFLPHGYTERVRWQELITDLPQRKRMRNSDLQKRGNSKALETANQATEALRHPLLRELLADLA